MVTHIRVRKNVIKTVKTLHKVSPIRIFRLGDVKYKGLCFKHFFTCMKPHWRLQKPQTRRHKRDKIVFFILVSLVKMTEKIVVGLINFQAQVKSRHRLSTIATLSGKFFRPHLDHFSNFSPCSFGENENKSCWRLIDSISHSYFYITSRNLWDAINYSSKHMWQERTFCDLHERAQETFIRGNFYAFQLASIGRFFYDFSVGKGINWQVWGDVSKKGWLDLIESSGFFKSFHLTQNCPFKY